MFAWIRGHLPTRETISPGKKQTNKNISGYSWFPDFEASKISHFRIYLIMKIEKKDLFRTVSSLPLSTFGFQKHNLMWYLLIC